MTNPSIDPLSEDEEVKENNTFGYNSEWHVIDPNEIPDEADEEAKREIALKMKKFTEEKQEKELKQ